MASSIANDKSASSASAADDNVCVYYETTKPWAIRCGKARGACMANTEPVTAKRISETSVYRLDTTVRVAQPNGYAIILYGFPARPDIKVMTGIIDAGYRGTIGILLNKPDCKFFPKEYPKTIQFNSNELFIRLKIVKLLTPIPRELVPHDESDPDTFLMNDRFFAVVRQKRQEDAGYDIPAPRPIIMEPMTMHRVTIPLIIRGGADRSACVFGRSSMNQRGLEVIPERITDDWLCSFNIFNHSRNNVMLNVDDRIAQILLIKGDHRRGNDATISTFPHCNDILDVLPWEQVPSVSDVAPESLRGANGFGSTGV